MSRRSVFCNLEDSEFIRGDVPMTKSEVRAIILSKLQLKNSDVVVDIGAGTGSIGICCALSCNEGMVYAIEKEEKGVELIQKNKENLHIENLEVILGRAPEMLNKVCKVDKAFIGGTTGAMSGIFNWLESNLKEDGRVVVSAITVETLSSSLEELKKRGYIDIEVTTVSVSKSKMIGKSTMMFGNNPINIISGKKIGGFKDE